MGKLFIEHVKIDQMPFPIVIGDMLRLSISADAATTLYNAHKVTDIESDGTIRVECINAKTGCKQIECTYLNLYDFEIVSAKIDNSIKESKRLGGITL